MRITTGKYKGRQIKMPKGIRPTQEKVRKAVFDILGDIEGLSFLELFAGSGAVGFEAMSRGASELTLIENNRTCFLVIEKNIELLRLNNCKAYCMDIQTAINKFYRDKHEFDIIFMDPPYYQDVSKKILQMLGGYDILSPNGLVIMQHFKRDLLSDKIGNLTIIKRASYADTVLTFYRKVLRCAR